LRIHGVPFIIFLLVVRLVPKFVLNASNHPNGSFRRLTREAHQRRFLVLPSGSVLGQTGSLLPFTGEALFTEESVPEEWRHPYVTFQRNDEQWCESLAEHADAALLVRAGKLTEGLTDFVLKDGILI
jgi:hypothetical protein